MASEKILKQKQAVVEEIKSHVESATSIVLFDYRGLTDNETKELRTELKESGTFYKVFKNTLMARAFKDLNIDLGDALNGPSALVYGTDQVAPVKTLTEFAKDHPALEIKGGIVDGNVTSLDEIKALSTIPSREGLLTMLAGGLIGTVKDLSIALNLLSEQKSE